MITERTLRQWRKDALRRNGHKDHIRTDGTGINVDTLYIDELNNRIIRLTGELMDIHLVQK